MSEKEAESVSVLTSKRDIDGLQRASSGILIHDTQLYDYGFDCQSW